MKNLKVFLALSLMVMFVFSSCGKDQVNNIEEVSATNEIQNIMVFDDLQHFQTHYETMEQLIDTDMEQFEKMVNENHVMTSYKKLINDKFVNIEDRYQPFLSDPVAMAIVNENYEFQIGDIVLTHINNEIILTAEVSNTEARAEIRSMPKGEILDFKTLPQNVFPVTDDNFETILGPWDGEEDYSFEAIEQASKTESASCETNGDTIWGWGDVTSTEGFSYRTTSYKSGASTKQRAWIIAKDYVNGQWVTGNADKLQIILNATVKNSNCEKPKDKDKERKCNNCSSKTATISTLGTKYHETGDVSASYSRWKDTGVGQGTETVKYQHIVY